MFKLLLFLSLPLYAMEPNVPAHLKERIETWPVHHTHSVTETVIAETAPNEVKITVEELKESDGDKDRVDSFTKKFVVITNGITAVVTVLITAGAGYGIAYAKCHG